MWKLGRDVAQAFSRPPPGRPGFESAPSHVRSVVDRAAMGQVLSKYFGFPCHPVITLTTPHHQHLSSRASTIGLINGPQ
jgi:hypothetical protein